MEMHFLFNFFVKRYTFFMDNNYLCKSYKCYKMAQIIIIYKENLINLINIIYVINKIISIIYIRLERFERKVQNRSA